MGLTRPSPSRPYPDPGREAPSRILDGSRALADALLSDEERPISEGQSPPCRFLPLYNEPAFANASHRIFAAR